MTSVEPSVEPKKIRLTVPKDLQGPVGEENQPVSRVRWVQRDLVQANDYNPNTVPAPEMRLLKISLLSDGWTQPIVVRPACVKDTDGDGDCPACARDDESLCRRYEVVDGFHRWLCADEKRIAAMTGGLVPVVLLAPKSREDQMMSTIRHNRARGNHQVLKMAEIAATMIAAGVEDEKIIQLLQMEAEELNRLKDRGSMIKRGAADDFGAGWTPA